MIVIVTVVMSLMMRICRCFTTDARDLNGQVEIMFRQAQSILGAQVPSVFLMRQSHRWKPFLHRTNLSLVDFANENARRRKESDPDIWRLENVDGGWVEGVLHMSSWRTLKLDRDAHYWHQGGKHFLQLDLEMSWVETDSFKSVDTSTL